MIDTRLALMCGIDIPIPECELTIHQPKIREIAYLGERDFFTGVSTVCVNKNMAIQDKSLLENTNNFQIFMMIMSEKQTSDKKKAVQQIFPLFFPSYSLILTPRSLLLKDKNQDKTIIIDESNFDYLQKTFSDICCIHSKSGQNQSTFNPVNDKAAEIAKKLMRGRQIIAEQKGETDTSVFSRYLSTLTVGLNSMSLEDLMNLTVFQLYDLVERYSLYLDWDLDIRSRLAGAKPDSSPENWMKNIH